MVRYLIPALSLAALVSCQSAQENNSKDTDITQTAEMAEDEWIQLFDGESKNGWHTYGKGEAGSAWQVQDGTLFLNVSAGNEGRGDLITDEEFSDFHLKLDWKISPNGNSGIIFFVHEDQEQYPNTYNTGLEMQVLDNNGHPDAKIHKHRAGDLYDLIASSEETVKPVGEWNQVEIISNKGSLVLFLNGTEVVSTTLWDENWETMVANSKFASMPGFGTYKSGKIALQDHGDEVWFRNIVIRKL